MSLCLEDHDEIREEAMEKCFDAMRLMLEKHQEKNAGNSYVLVMFEILEEAKKRIKERDYEKPI